MSENQRYILIGVAFARVFGDDHYYHFRLVYGFGMVMILYYYVNHP